MPKTPPWTRRTFVQAFGSLTALTSMPQWAFASSQRESRATPTTKFSFIASAKGTITVFSISQAGDWTRTQTVPSSAPAALAISPDQRFLYVANAVRSFQNRPTASVEAYAISNQTGNLSLRNKQSLALHATMPKHLAVSPNGRLLAVAVEDDRVYNLLPIDEKGTLHPVTASLKPLGRSVDGMDPQHPWPYAVFFQDNETVIAVDKGRSLISSLSIDEDLGFSLSDFENSVQVNAAAHIVASPSSGIYFAASSNDAVITSILPDQNTPGRLRIAQKFTLPSINSSTTALAAHPAGNLLFAATSEDISTIRIDPSGSLHSSSNSHHSFGEVKNLQVSIDGQHLFATTGSGVVLRITIDARQGSLSSFDEVASVIEPTALVLKYS